jgi:hypothetical protein
MSGDKIENGNSNDKAGTKKISKGLTLLDLKAIEEVLPTVEMMSPVISYNYSAMIDGKSKPVVLLGVNTNYFRLFNIGLQSGQIFNRLQSEAGQPVCVIGANVATVFFNQDNRLNADKSGSRLLVWLNDAILRPQHPMKWESAVPIIKYLFRHKRFSCALKTGR